MTDTENRHLLEELNRSDLRTDNTSATLVPERGHVYFKHADQENRQFETFTAVGGAGFEGRPNHQVSSRQSLSLRDLKTVGQSTYAPSDFTPDSQLSTNAECDGGKITGDILFCVMNYADCALCTLGSPAPPVYAACWVIICLDGGVSAAAEVLLDFGCLSGFGRSGACIENVLGNFVNEYGDDIPSPPDLPF